MNKYLKYILIIVVVIVLLILFLIMYKNYKKIDDADLKIYFFNAGKADACIISINNKYMMIDTGEEDLADEVLKYFNDNNIKTLDYLIITHFDKDHVGSASKIIDNIEVLNVLQNNTPKNSEYYDNYMNSLIVNRIDAVTVEDSKSYELEDISFNVIGTKSVFDEDESNNASLIVEMTYKNNKFLFTGDIENDRIKEYLKSDLKHYDFIKMPHHGKIEKKLDDLLEAVTPRYALITSSEEEKEDEEVINLLRNLNIKYYLTRNGAVTIRANGNYIKVEQ